MTINVKQVAFVEDGHQQEEAEIQQVDSWRVASVSPEPTAPSEFDVAMDMDMDIGEDGNIRISEYPGWPDTLITTERDLPPALPVAVMDPIHPQLARVFYDYQRDQVVYSPTSIVADISESEYQRFLDTLEGDQDQNSTQEQLPSTAVASGVAGAVVGTLALGTFPGIIAGFYSAYAHGQVGVVGDIARALGEIALITRDKALAVDRKHNLVVRGKLALAEAWEHAKELNRQHHVIRRLKEFTFFAWTMTLHFVRRNCRLPPTPDNCNSRQLVGSRHRNNRHPSPVCSRNVEYRQHGSCYHRAGAVPIESNDRTHRARFY